MSKVVDERVVEMRFDNSNFEKNIQGTLSTLDKFKQKLNLDGAAKGLDTVGKAAKNVDMSNLSKGLETAKSKFSALEVMGVTALANLTNSAVNAGKRIVASLTIDPVKAGFNEYELKMNSVQTIMASTGESLETVNKYLEELNAYSDQTIYSFSDMTQNIGKFTNAGVKLDDAVLAIKGISNAAALSGANANEASRAMYNFSQALSSGYVKLIDWKSIENANMATVQFKEQLLESAVAAGTLTKTADGMYQTLSGTVISATKNFNDSLQEQWMTTDALVGTLRDYADENTEIGKKATQAATEVKTFSMMLDTLRESAQSGWAKTWEIIFGDFYEGKALWTSMTEAIGGVIDRMSDFRNKVLEIALGKNFIGLFDRVRGAIDSISKAGETVGETISGLLNPLSKTTDGIANMVSGLLDYDDLVTEIIQGKWNNGQPRWDALTKAGYDWAHAQNLVNERLGCSVRYATNYAEAQNGVNDAQADGADAQNALSEAGAKHLANLTELSDAELKAQGYTEDQIRALRELQKEAAKTGYSFEEFIKNIDKINGRSLLMDSFANIGNSILAVFEAIKDAWFEIFEITPEGLGQTLYDMIAAFHKLTSKLKVNDEAADKIKRTFKGLFAILDVVLTVIGGPIKIAFKLLSQFLGACNVDILGFTANIGDAIVKFRDWVDSTLDFTKVFEKIVPNIKSAINSIKAWINTLKESKNLPRDIAQGIVNGFGAAVSFIVNIIKQLISYVTGGFNQLPEFMTSGFVGGIWNSIKIIGQTMVELGKIIIDKIKDVLGIHSPSTVFFAIGGFIIAGLLGGLAAGSTSVFDYIKQFGTKIAEIFSKIDFGSLFASGISVGTLVVMTKLISAVTSPLAQLGDVLDSVADIIQTARRTVRAFTGVLRSFSLSIKANALKSIAIALAILVGSIALLTFLDTTKVWIAVGVLASLAVIIGVLSNAIGKFGAKGSIDVAKFAGLIFTISLSLLLLAGVMKILAGMTWDDLGKAAVGIVALGGLIVGLIAATKLAGNRLVRVGPTILKLSMAMILLAVTAKIIGGMEWSELGKAAVGIVALGGLIVGLIAATKLAGNRLARVGPTILKISAAMILLAVTAKILAGMTWGEFGKAALGIVGLGAFIVGLIYVTKLAGPRVGKVGATILQLSAAMLLLSLTAKILGGMEWGELGKAAVGLVGLGAIIAGLIWATNLAGPTELARVGTTLIMMSIAIGILAGVCVVLGLMSIPALLKGVLAVSILGSIMALMIHATKGAQACKGNILAMAAAIAVIAVSVAALSFIEPSKLIGATVALSALMGMFVLIEKHSAAASKSMGSLIVMTVAIGILTAALCVLASLPMESILSAAVSLSAVMLALTVSLKILSGVGSSAGNALVGVIALLMMAVPLLAFVGILAIMQNIQNAASNAMVLATLVTVMTLLLVPLTIIGAAGVTGAPYMGVLALLALAVPLLAFVGILAIMENLPNAIANANVLIKLMGAMTAMLVVLAVVGPLAMVGIQAMATLELLMLATGAVVMAIGALMEKFPALETFMNSGIETLKRLAQGMGEIISAFGVGLTSGLPEIGANLSSFMTNLSGFISGANSIKDDLGKKIMTLSGAIILLTAADLIAGISSLIQNGSSFAQLGADLSAFMVSAMPFIMGASAINPDSLAGIKSLAEAVLILTAADILSGLTSWFTGGVNFAEFGAELAAFGPYMAAYASAVAGIDAKAVEASATAAKALAEMAGALPNSGGVVGWFMGENDMGVFGEQLKAFGSALKEYSISVTGIVLESIMTSVEAGKALAEMADIIPNLGGVVGWFMGDNGLDTFGAQLVPFGTALKAYSLAVMGLSLESVMISVEAGKALADLADSMPNIGGMVSWFTGDNGLDAFGEKLIPFGESLKAYSMAVAGLNIETITASVDAATQLAKLAEALPTDGGFWSLFKDDKINFEDFGKEIKNLGKGMQDYSDEVSGLNTSVVTTSITAIEDLIDLIKRMNGITKDSVSGFTAAIKSLASTNINKLVNAFESAGPKLNNTGFNIIKSVADGAESAKTTLTTALNNTIDAATKLLTNKGTSFESAGSKLMSSSGYKSFVSGINKAKSKVKNAMSKAAESAVSAIRSQYSKFYKAGTYVVTGFVKGISDNKWRATNAGTSLGKAAYKAAKAAIDSNSPSKKFMELGMFADQGLAKGLLDYAYLATRASAGLGRSIVDSMQEELDINSPAKVIKDEVGRYIVEGLAEGIKSDMSAEEAAEQKAKNIADAFNDEFAKHDTDLETFDLQQELWEVNNPDASEAVKAAMQAATIRKRIKAQTEKVDLAKGEYEVTRGEFGVDSEKTQEAYNKWMSEQIKLDKESAKLTELANEEKERVIDKHDEAISKLDEELNTYDLEHELWASQNESASAAEKTAQEAALIYSRIATQNEKVSIAQQKYKSTVEQYGKDSEEAQQAYNEWVQTQIDLNGETTRLLELRNQSIADANEAADLDMEKKDLERELWGANNSKAGEAEKSSKDLDNVLDKLPEQAKKVGLARATWEAAKERYGEDANETKQAYNEYLRAQIDLATLTESAGTAYDKALKDNRASWTAYSKLLKDNTKDFLAIGMSMDQIQAWAREQSGYDPDELKRLLAMDVDSSAKDAMGIVEDTYEKYAGMTFEALTKSGNESGEEYGKEVSEGVKTGATGAESAVQTVAGVCAEGLTANQENWVELGKQFVTKFAEGVISAVDTATEATIKMVSSAYQAAIDFINNPENGGFTATLSPVLDLSKFQNGVGAMNGMFATSTAALANINVRLTNDSIAELSEIADEMRRLNESSHSEIVNAIKDVRGDIDALGRAIDGMQITMDGNAVVGSIISKIDNSLGQIVNHKGRGN